MGRFLKILIMAVLFLLPIIVAVSSDSALSSSAGEENELQPETTAFFNSPTLFFNPEVTPEPATPTPAVPVDVLLWLDVRTDLETLADARLGVGVRPGGWNGVLDRVNPEIPLLTRLDLETLATQLINPEQRPAGWIGAVSTTPYYVARDGRHDLELLANLYYGPSERPAGWLGGDPLMKCNRATQTLVTLLERGGVYNLQVDANDPEFCKKAEISVTQYTETQILGNAQIGDLFTDELIILSPNNITTDTAIAWLDSTARLKVGVIPRGTPIQIIGRSYATFSNMMLVSGDNFQVFVEYPNTTVSDSEFRRLPNVAGLQTAPYCFAAWCETSN